MARKSRIARLEAAFEQQTILQGGLLRKLPDSYVGEKHIVVVKRQATTTPNWEWCEFEERPGPAPEGNDAGFSRIYLDEIDAML